ncbi:FAD:protein FMN transferase [Paenimyroides tangerinum]|uniref:FAD:protein FMN transferase n=2 Tax=Paenimyroides tangerinum TaxID=2488728 RepID=A0A3P3WFI6_9FLAO|nr:FAD:protein FMN transferase [Paenimyroides tangerinum]
MGSSFDVSIVAENEALAENYIQQVFEEVIRIDLLISDWKPNSQISEVNKNAGIKPVKVDKEVFDLTKRALQFSEITNGAFDITVASMDKIWSFDGLMDELPTKEAIQKSIENVGYKNVILNESESTIFLSKKGMKIGFGATGKGYAADKGRELMLKLGIKGGIVNASGDLASWGRQPDRKSWLIGLRDPFKNGAILRTFPVRNAAMCTSGDYQKFALIDGIRYSHIINLKTGIPATGLTSVTVLGPEAETANAFSTSIMVLGAEAGLQLLNNYPDYACLIITEDNDIITSKNYKKVLKNLNTDN